MDDKTKGMYDKFRVTRNDGSSEPGGKHENCFYFVLDLDHDPSAVTAMLAYAENVREEGYEALAEDIVKKVTEQIAKHNKSLKTMTGAEIADSGETVANEHKFTGDHESEVFDELNSQTYEEQKYEAVESEIIKTIYQAALIFEKLEASGLIVGNGHHVAQKMAEAAREELEKRWKGAVPKIEPVVKGFVVHKLKSE